MMALALARLLQLGGAAAATPLPSGCALPPSNPHPSWAPPLHTPAKQPLLSRAPEPLSHPLG